MNRPARFLATVTWLGLVVAFGMFGSGLVLAMVGRYSIGAHAAATITLSYFVARRPGIWVDREESWISVLTLGLIAAAVVAMGVASNSELILAGRDGGTYTNSAAYLLSQGTLLPDSGAEVFADFDQPEMQAPGFVPTPDGRVWMQFLHANAAFMALVGGWGGLDAMSTSMVWIGALAVLAFYQLSRLWLGRGWALFAVTLMVSTLPFVYFVRSTFSELPALAFGAGGLWILERALAVSDRRLSYFSGALLGATALVRVDGWALGIGLAILAVWSADDPRMRPVARRALAGFMGIGLLSIADLVLYGRPYLFILGNQFVSIVSLAILLWLVSISTVGSRLSVLGKRIGAVRGVGASIGIALVALLLFLWFARPYLWVAHESFPYDLETMQVAEGLTVDATRTYAELSMRWLSWYLGPLLLVMSIVTAGIGVRTSVRQADWMLRAAVLTFLIPTILYVVRPSINPDHIWAMRRYLPVVIPGAILFGVAGSAHALSFINLRLQRTARIGVTVFVAVGLAMPIMNTTRHLATHADGRGSIDGILELCESLQRYSRVVIIDPHDDVPLSYRLGPPIRAICERPVAGITPEALTERVPSPEHSTGVLRLVDDATETFMLIEIESWTSRLSSPPHATTTLQMRIQVRDAE